MLEVRKDLELFHEGGSDSGGFLGYHLERKNAVELRVENAVDPSEAAFANKAFDPISRR